MMGRQPSNKMAASSETDQRVEFVDNSLLEFNDLEEFIPDISEVGSKQVCQECGHDIFASAIVCSNDLCSGNSGDPAIFHSVCMGFQHEHDVNSSDVVLDQEWFCPKCRSCNTSADMTDSTSLRRSPGSNGIDVVDSNPEKVQEKNPPNAQQKKKVSIKRPAAVFTCADVAMNTVGYVLQILAALKVHSVFSRKEFHNTKPMQELGAQLNTNSGHVSFGNFWKWTGNKLWEIITAADHRVLSAQSYDIISTNFHLFRIGEVRDKWDALLQELQIINVDGKVSEIILQYCLRSLKERIIKERNKADLPEESLEETSPLSTHDHQVINYIAGFVPFALIKRFSKVKTPMAADFVKLLKSWQLNDLNEESFVSYARDWFNKQNKGYLFQPSWDLHVLFRTLEYVGRKLLVKSKIGAYKENSLQELLLSTFLQNVTVQSRWSELVKDKLDNKQNDKLFKIILRYWVKIRCTAYVKVYIDIRKAQDKNISRKGANSLRKTVDKN